jgi:hypothetical protein
MSPPQPPTTSPSFNPFAIHPFTSLQSPPSSSLQQYDDSLSGNPERLGPASSYNVHFTRAMSASSQLLQSPSPTPERATLSFSPPLGPSMTPNPPSSRVQGSQGHVFTGLRFELEGRHGQKGAADDLPVLKKKSYTYDGF